MVCLLVIIDGFVKTYHLKPPQYESNQLQFVLRRLYYSLFTAV